MSDNGLKEGVIGLPTVVVLLPVKKTTGRCQAAKLMTFTDGSILSMLVQEAYLLIFLQD